MKLGWRYLSTRWQFFIAIAGTSLLLVAIVLTGVRSYFSYNFTEYLAAQERERLSQVALVLGDYYGQQNTRQHSQPAVENNNLNQWQQTLRAIQRDVFFNPDKLNLDTQLAFTQLHLITPSGDTVFGQPIENAVSVAVIVRLSQVGSSQGEPKVVGHLYAPRPEGANAPIDEVFQAQQASAFVFAGLLAVLLAALAAIGVSFVLRKRLLALAKVSRALAKGEYAATADASGNDDISVLAGDMNALANTLAVSREQRRQLLADVAHELRTPLTVLQGDIEAVQDGIRQADSKHQARLHQQVLHLARLTEDLHQLAQADSGALAYQNELCDVSALTKQLVDGYKNRAAQSGLVLTYNVVGTPYELFVDPVRLQQGLTNLLENSLRYTAGPGTINCTLDFTNAEQVSWRLEDSSPGLSAEQCTRLGERLYRPDSARSRSSGGSGLGLAIVRSIVKSHQGSISFAPSPLGGLSVELRIPRGKV